MRPLRIVVIGNIIREYSMFVTGVREGIFLLGHRYRGIDFRTTSFKDMWNLLWEFKPDYIFTHMILNERIGKTPQTLEILSRIRQKLGTRVIHTMQDARTTSRYPHDISNAVDIGLINQTQELESFARTWKIPVYYWPYASLKQHEIAAPIDYLKFEMVYTGNMQGGIYAERTRFVRKVAELLPLKIVETQSDHDLRSQTPELAASARSILGVGLRYDIEGYIDVRPFQYIGAGALLITHEYAGMDKIFEHQHLLTFSGTDPSVVKQYYDWIVAHPDRASVIRRRGFDYVQRCHNYLVRIGDAIDTVEGRRERPRVLLDDF